MPSWWNPLGGTSPDDGGRARPSEGALAWLRKLVGWPGAPAARDTPAERELVRERVRSGPQGIKLPWFLPYFDDQQTIGETQEMRLAYRYMLRDPNVSSAFQGRILAACGLDLKVIPRDRKDPLQAADAELIRWNLEDALEGGVPGLIWSVLSGALIDGYSVCEKVWAREAAGEHAGAYYLRAVKPKDTGRDVALETDEFRNVVSVRGLRYNPGVSYHPANFLVYRHMPLWDVASGQSAFRCVYGSWWMLDVVKKLRAVGLEKRALPVVVGEFTNAQDAPAVEEALALVKSQNWLAVPAGARVTALNIAGAADSAFDSACRQLAEDIFLGIAGATLQARQGDVNNARGSSAEHRNTADLFISALTTGITQLLNDRQRGLVKDILDLNRVVNGSYPKVQLAAVDEKDMVSRLAIYTGLWEIGVATSREAIYDEFNVQPPDASDHEDSLGGKADQEAQVAAATMAAPGGPGGAAAADRVLVDETKSSPPDGAPPAGAGGAGEITGPYGPAGSPPGAEQMVEGDGQDEPPDPYQPGDRVRLSTLTQSKGKMAGIGRRIRGLVRLVHENQSDLEPHQLRVYHPIYGNSHVIDRALVSHDTHPEDMAERPPMPQGMRVGGTEPGVGKPVSTGAGVDKVGRHYARVGGKPTKLPRGGFAVIDGRRVPLPAVDEAWLRQHVEPLSERDSGRPWKGPSGMWFRHDGERVVRCAAPERMAEEPREEAQPIPAPPPTRQQAPPQAGGGVARQEVPARPQQQPQQPAESERPLPGGAQGARRQAIEDARSKRGREAKLGKLSWEEAKAGPADPADSAPRVKAMILQLQRAHLLDDEGLDEVLGSLKGRPDAELLEIGRGLGIGHDDPDVVANPERVIGRAFRAIKQRRGQASQQPPSRPVPAQQPPAPPTRQQSPQAKPQRQPDPAAPADAGQRAARMRQAQAAGLTPIAKPVRRPLEAHPEDDYGRLEGEHLPDALPYVPPVPQEALPATPSQAAPRKGPPPLPRRTHEDEGRDFLGALGKLPGQVAGAARRAYDADEQDAQDAVGGMLGTAARAVGRGAAAVGRGAAATGRAVGRGAAALGRPIARATDAAIGKVTDAVGRIDDAGDQLYNTPLAGDAGLRGRGPAGPAPALEPEVPDTTRTRAAADKLLARAGRMSSAQKQHVGGQLERASDQHLRQLAAHLYGAGVVPHDATRETLLAGLRHGLEHGFPATKHDEGGDVDLFTARPRRM